MPLTYIMHGPFNTGDFELLTGIFVNKDIELDIPVYILYILHAILVAISIIIAIIMIKRLTNSVLHPNIRTLLEFQVF